MTEPPFGPFTVPPEHAGQTLAALLRALLPGLSWSRVRRLIETRRVRVGADVCRDPARRLREAEAVEILARAEPARADSPGIAIRHLDKHLVVIEKPSGLSTVRHPAERYVSRRRKMLSPTVEDVLPGLIAQQEGHACKGVLPRLRVVHRLDKETSGLLVFARTVAAERGLGLQFRHHTVTRRYLAVVAGYLPPQRIASRLVRDRGDGRRGSSNLPGVGKEAVTHVVVEERLAGYTILSCRLQTGRTHQIRIHLAERGHPICGEKVYIRAPGMPPEEDRSGAPRLALHAAELGFQHPVTGQPMHWTMPLPQDLARWLESLRGRLGGAEP